MNQIEIARKLQQICQFFQNIQGNHLFCIDHLKISVQFCAISVVASQSLPIKSNDQSVAIESKLPETMASLDNNNKIPFQHDKSPSVLSVRSTGDKVTEVFQWLCEHLVILLALPIVIFQEANSWWASWREINPSKVNRLEGKVVLITGANSGIGEGLAKYFYLAGCKLILAARRRSELERVRDSLRALETGRVRCTDPVVLELDLADGKSILGKAKAAISVHGGIDILVNNAGVFNQGSVLDTVMEVDEQIMGVNYLGTLALTKAVGNHMKTHGQGQICFVSSVLGKMTITNSLSYSASKRALQALADCLRAEVSQFGINVTIVSPSYVNTPISVNALSSTGKKVGVVTKEIETGYSVDYVSERIFKAVVNQESDVTIAPITHRMAIHLRNLMPSVFFVVSQLYGKRFKM